MDRNGYDLTAFNVEKVEKNVMPRIPQRRWGIPADFGPIAVYFASDTGAYHSGDAVHNRWQLQLFLDIHLKSVAGHSISHKNWQIKGFHNE